MYADIHLPTLHLVISPTVPYTSQPREANSNTAVQLSQQQGNTAQTDTLSFSLLF